MRATRWLCRTTRHRVDRLEARVAELERAVLTMQCRQDCQCDQRPQRAAGERSDHE